MAAADLAWLSNKEVDCYLLGCSCEALQPHWEQQLAAEEKGVRKPGTLEEPGLKKGIKELVAEVGYLHQSGIALDAITAVMAAHLPPELFQRLTNSRVLAA